MLPTIEDVLHKLSKASVRFLRRPVGPRPATLLSGLQLQNRVSPVGRQLLYLLFWAEWSITVNGYWRNRILFKRVLCDKFPRIQQFVCFWNQAYISGQFASNIIYMFLPCFCYLYKHLDTQQTVGMAHFINDTLIESNMGDSLSSWEHRKWVLIWKFISIKANWHIIHSADYKFRHVFSFFSY